MQCFLGVIPFEELPFARLLGRSRYLPAGVLHFSLEGRVALCTGGCIGRGGLLLRRGCPHLLGAIGSDEVRETAEDLLTAYNRLGLRCGRRLAEGVCFAVWDGRRDRLLLGATSDARCYVSHEEDGLWFSSEAAVLSHPIAVTLGVFPYDSFQPKKHRKQD